jgi:hypothetical protein
MNASQRGMNHHNVYKGKASLRPSGAPSPRENSSAVTFSSVSTLWHAEPPFQCGITTRAVGEPVIHMQKN